MLAKNKKLIFILLIGVCLTVIGCESTNEKIHKTDAWIKDNMW